ncbi:MAG: hypothetical protein AMXMBFR34_47060 [Myxococcaceae bacterium]
MTAPRPPERPRPFERWFSLGLGLLLIGAAGYALVQFGAAGGVVGAVVLGGLGLEATLAAIRDRRSLLARLGPLP